MTLAGGKRQAVALDKNLHELAEQNLSHPETGDMFIYGTSRMEVARAAFIFSKANGRVVHRMGFAKTYSTNVVEGA